MPAAVVVTGASGFVGGHVVEALLAAGERVVTVDRVPAPSHLAGTEHLTVELTHGGPALTAALRDAAAVIHLAGCPGVRDTAHDVADRRQRDNVVATAAVLASTPRRRQVVVASSSSVYGGSAWSRPSRESDPVRPRGGYARSKLSAERLCARRADAGGAVVVARPFTVAGERQRPDMALSLWIEAASAGLPLRFLGSGLRTRDVTDVRDVARALVALALGGAGGTVNIGTGRAHTLDELADAVCAAVGRDVPRVVVPARPEEARDTLADTRRLDELVGFVPRTDLHALVARQLAATPTPSATDEPALVGAP